MSIKNVNSTINAVKSKVFDWFIGYIVPTLVMFIFAAGIEMALWRVGVDKDLENLAGLKELTPRTETVLARRGLLEVNADSPGLVGGFPGGALQIISRYADANANAVITGHNLNNRNKQLWYLGSYSSRNDDVIYINRQDAALLLGTNNSIRFTISPAGSVGINTRAPNPSSLLDLQSTIKGFLPPRMTTAQRDAIIAPVAGLVIYNITTGVLNFHNGISWGAVQK